MYIYIYIAYFYSKPESLVQPRSQPAAWAESMYTFGAPAVSRPAMPDLNQADHCFRGLRTYTDTWRTVSPWSNHGKTIGIC